MGIDVINNLIYRFRKLRYINNISAEYYGRMNRRVVIPSITISAISSILSFMATSDIITSSAKSYLSLSVGILTIAITASQTMSNSLGFSVRTEAFSKAADEYNKIIVRLKMKHIDCDKAEIDELLEDIEDKVVDIANNTKFLPPSWVYEKWTTDKHIYIGSQLGSDNADKNLIKQIHNWGNPTDETIELQDVNNDVSSVDL